MKQVNNSEVRINNDEASPTYKYQTPSINVLSDKSRNRLTGFLILIILFGAFWVYGWGGEIRLVQATTQPSNLTSQVIYSKLIILSAIFTVIGFGLLLGYYKHMGMVALLLSLFIVSITVICSPFVSKFWFNVLISDFKGATFTSTDPYRFILQSFGGLTVFLDLYNIKVAFANSISQLVMLLGVFGRLNAVQVVLNTILYNTYWNLCHFLCVKLLKVSPDTRIFDDYQISNVYLFASCYAIMLSLILPKRTKKDLSHSKPSAILALLGTFFIFLSFCATSTLFPLKFTPGQAEYARSYIWQEGFISVFFALSASVIFSCAGSVLFGTAKDEVRGVQLARFGIRQCVFGTISGGIGYGAVAGTSVNVGAAIASGLFSGLLSALIYRLVHKKMNQDSLFDSYGVFITLLVSFFGTFLIAPIILTAYYYRDWILTTLSVSNLDTVGLPLVNSSIVGWTLSYVGISIGIGLVSGLIVGLLLRCLSSDVSLHNQEYFSLHYGLTANNPDIFQEDLPISTKFESALNVIRGRKIQKKVILSVIENYEMNEEGGKLIVYKEDSVDVRLHGDFQENDIHGITQELNNLKLNPKFSQEYDPIQPVEGRAEESDTRKFKVLYFLLKSREIYNHLNGSSLINLEAETSQRSVGGVIQRRAKINASFRKRDEGSDYLDLLKKQYGGLSLETNIRS